DPLWSDPNIDFIGIDNYLPVADWRDGSTHADATGFPTVASPHDPAYLKAQVEGGEGYDWYYATPNDRDAQTRTPIIDSASGKDWVFRQKDIRNWWLSAHHDRPAGLEAATPTPWQPQSKPIWLTEIGCPAIEKGANQPNVFHDPKSSESFFPRYSSGARDDVAQRRTVETIIDYWSSGSGQNPVSNVYGAPMVDTARTHVWAWDARSFPAFPADTTLWADALNWDRGHWLNGRLGTAPSDGLVAHIMTDAGFAPDQWETHLWDTTIDGFAVERVMSVRDALDPLEHALGITGFESGGRIVFIGRRGRPVAALDAGSLVDTASDSEAVGLVEEVRAQETELPAAIQLTVLEPLGTYASVTVDARRPVDVGTGASRRVSSSTLPLALAPEMAQSLAEQWLHAALTRRARQSFALPPSALRFEPGDIISLEVAGGSGDRTVRIEAISDGAARSVASVSHDAAHLAAGPILRRKDYAGDSAVSGPPTFCFLDLPLLSSDDTDGALYAAAYAKPWDDGVALYRAPGTAGYALEGTITDPAGMGRTLSAWRSGPRAQWDRATTLDIIMPGRTLQSAPDLLVFDGANGFAIETAPEVWEVFQAADIELIGAGTYRLSRLLRAQLGTDPGLEVIPPEGVPTGARIIALDSTVHTQRVATDRIGVAANWRFGPANKAVSDSTYTSLVHTPAGVAARPYAPAQLRALRQTGGDIAISWTRRTRRGGDGWQLVDVPLGEDVEAYEIDIFDGPSVVRTIAAFGPGASYTAAQQLADFGALPPAVTLHVFQMSATIGRGAPREIHVEF
ncbi:MAG: glycoside hydrolase TIM-barrel-like domain-containing protein, partial [Pseudomonadota bacterium]